MADDKKIASGSVNDLVKAFEKDRKGQFEANKAQVSRLEEIADKIKDQTDTIDLQTKNDGATSKSLRKLEMTTAAGDPLIQQLREDYERSSASLESAIASGDQQRIEMARKQVEATEKTIQSEEDKREALKKQEEANSLLTRIGDGVSNFTSNVGQTAGFLAGIAGLATLFFSPETFGKIVRKAIDTVSAIVSVIDDFINGDFESAKATIKENFAEFGTILGVGIILALPKLLGVFQKLKTAFTTFGVFMKSEFVKNMMSNLKSMMKSVGGALMNPIKTLTNLFTAFQTTMIGKFLVQMTENLKSMMASVGKALMNPITTLKNLFLAFKSSMIVTFVVDMTKNLMSMMASVGSALMNPIATLRKLFTGFRVFMTATFIPGMIAALSGMMASIGGLLVAMAPILIPILAIGALFAAIAFALTKVRDAMGFTSVFDVIMYGLSFIQDGFAHLGNVFIKIAKKIAGLGARLLEFLGVDVPDWVYKARDMELLRTDNAARKKVELQAKAEQQRIEKEQEAMRQEEATKPDATGTDLINTSTENALATPAAANPVVVSNQQSSNVNNASTVTSNIISGRPLRTSGLQLSFSR